LDLRKFPISYVQGKPGTGKSTILEILQVLCKGASKFTGRGTREAAARDELSFLGTAIIEEADYDVYKQTNLQLFGATVLHSRYGADIQEIFLRKVGSYHLK
jgi:predicted ATPase